MRNHYLYGAVFARAFVAACFIIASSSSHAALLFTNYTGVNPSGGASAGSSALWGSEFTVAGVGLTVNQLGAWDYLKDGFDNSHKVGIWETSSGTLVTSAEVPAGTVGTLIEDWRFVDIAPVTLNPNTTYRIAALYPVLGSDQKPVSLGPTYSSHTGIASVGVGDFSSFTNGGSGAENLVMPPVNNPRGRVAGNANVSITAVPVPAALPLFLFGIGFLGWYRRRHRLDRLLDSTH